MRAVCQFDATPLPFVCCTMYDIIVMFFCQLRLELDASVCISPLVM